MIQCRKHEWTPIMPPSDNVAGSQRSAYAFMVMLRKLWHVKYCQHCNKVGYSVHGRKIKTCMEGDHYKTAANKLRAQFHLPALPELKIIL